jgi:hypothetical protein
MSVDRRVERSVTSTAEGRGVPTSHYFLCPRGDPEGVVLTKCPSRCYLAPSSLLCMMTSWSHFPSQARFRHPGGSFRWEKVGEVHTGFQFWSTTFLS